MTSKTSFPQRTNEFRQTFRWSLKKNVGMMGLLAALMFVCIPLPLMLALFNEASPVGAQQTAEQLRNNLADNYASSLNMLIPAAGLSLLLLFAVVMNVRLFSYMQTRRSVDLYHALPVGRVPMLLGRWCAGMTILMLPALANFAVLAGVALAYRIPMYMGSMYIGEGLCWLLLGTAAAFSFLLFLSVCSGSVMDTLLSALGVNVGWPAAVFCCQYLISHTLPGVGDNGFNSFVLSLFSPFAAAYLPFFPSWNELPSWFLPWWIFLAAALLAGACLLYLRRKSEAAEDRFAFPAPKIAIRFLLTACGGLGLGLIASMTIQSNLPVFLVFTAAGSLLAHCVVEAIYSRGFRNLKKSLRWYGAFVVCFAAFYGTLAAGCFGYDTWVPDASEVESVSVQAGNTNGSWPGGGSVYDNDHYDGWIKLNPVLKKPESIQAVIGTHRSMAEKYRSTQFPYTPRIGAGNCLTLNYRLKNGKTVTRSYNSLADDPSGWTDKTISQINRLPEYCTGSDILFYLEPEDIEAVTVYSSSNEGEEYILSGAESDLRRELMDALRTDLLNGEETSDGNMQNPFLQLRFRSHIQPSTRLREALGGYAKATLWAGEPTYGYQAGGEVDRVLKKIAKRGTSSAAPAK